MNNLLKRDTNSELSETVEELPKSPIEDFPPSALRRLFTLSTPFYCRKQ